VQASQVKQIKFLQIGLVSRLKFSLFSLGLFVTNNCENTEKSVE
jgi:hypothetical protein